MIKTTIRYILLLAFFALAGCTKDREEPRYPHSSRVVLVYMAGDNSLGGYAQENLEAMARGMASAPAGGRTIAYVDMPGERPRLVEVTASGTKTLHTWPGPHNSASVATVREVIGLVRSMAPADCYGLVLWSHGLAWMPSWATGYLTRSKARMEERWPATKHGEATSEASAGFDPVSCPTAAPVPVTATEPASITRTDFTSVDRLIRQASSAATAPWPATKPDEAVCDALSSSARSAASPITCVLPNRSMSAPRSSVIARFCPGDSAVRFSSVHSFNSGEVSVPVTETDPAPTFWPPIKLADTSGASAEYLPSAISPAAVPASFEGVGSAFPVSAPASWPRTKWFGQDTGESPAGYLDTEQLAQAIPSGVFDWILFDACFMASAETLYALRDKAARIVCSPAEVIADGFPYEKIMPELLRSEPDLRAVCEGYYRHYADDVRPTYRSATVSLVETPELEALAAATASVLAAALAADPGVLADMDLNHLQPLDRYRRHFLFDMGSVVAQLEIRGLVPAPVAGAWRAQLARTVPYEAHTPTMLGLELDACCGLSMYVPVSAYADLNEYYRTLGWYARCYPADYDIMR